jgi:putative membrane protein
MRQLARIQRFGRAQLLGFALFSWAVIIALAICFGGSDALSEPASSSSKSPAKVKLTDANIAAIVVAANTIDVQNGQLALSKSQNAEVKTFASQMVTDHTSVNEKATELVVRLKVVRLKVTPKESEQSLALKAGAAATLARLESETGVAFDHAYVDNEVAYHQAVIDMLDHALIPDARNKDLKALLVAVRPAFVAHLEHAQHIQASLRGQ